MASQEASSASSRRVRMKRHPSDVHLRELSNEIGAEYNSLATYLGYTRADLDHLRLNHHTYQDRIFNMLAYWKQENFQINDLFSVLMKALKDVKRVDLACKVEEWKKEPHKSRDIVDSSEDCPDGATSAEGQKSQSNGSFSRLEEVDLRDLSGQIGVEWEKFATFLGLKVSDIYQIKLCHDDANDRVFEVLITWQRNMSKNTNIVKTLAKALEDSGRRDLKDELLEKAVYKYPEEKKKEDIERDLLEVYDLPPFLGEMMNSYKKIEDPTIPFELFIELCLSLDPPSALGNDWRRLADRLGLSRFIPYLESEYKDGPTSGVLWCWMKKNKSLEELARVLEDMDRRDVASKVNTHLGIVPGDNESDDND